MMARTCTHFALVATLAAAVPAAAQEAAPQAWKAPDLSFSAPAVVITLEGETLTGQPSRLAWSPGDNLLYVQTLQGTFGRPEAKLRHFLVDAAGGELREMPAEPEWAPLRGEPKFQQLMKAAEARADAQPRPKK